MDYTLHTFRAVLDIIGINPFVYVPDGVLADIFRQAGRDKSPIPVCGTVNGKPYTQTLMKFQGQWRLYINLLMLKNSPDRIGEEIEVSIRYDPVKRVAPMHPDLAEILEANPQARAAFDKFTPSRQQEILKTLHRLKTREALDRNLQKIKQLLIRKE